MVRDSSEEDISEDEDYADIEHNFDDDENEEELMQRLEEIGDSGRSKHKTFEGIPKQWHQTISCLLYTSPSPRDGLLSRMPSSA